MEIRNSSGHAIALLDFYDYSSQTVSGLSAGTHYVRLRYYGNDNHYYLGNTFNYNLRINRRQLFTDVYPLNVLGRSVQTTIDTVGGRKIFTFDLPSASDVGGRIDFSITSVTNSPYLRPRMGVFVNESGGVCKHLTQGQASF